MKRETVLQAIEERIDEERLLRAAEVLRVVAHPVRLRTVELLERGELTVGEIQERLGVSQSVTSQHLSQMRTRGVVAARRVGTQVYYSIANPDVVKVIHCIRRG